MNISATTQITVLVLSAWSFMRYLAWSKRHKALPPKATTIECPRCSNPVVPRTRTFKGTVMIRIDCPKCGCHAFRHEGEKEFWWDPHSTAPMWHKP